MVSALRDVVATVTAVGLGGVLGANARYVLGTWAQAAWGSAFPWGTLLINVLGSLLTGVFLTLATERLTIRPATRLFVATGILGAFTTFSTMSYELVHLLQAGALIRAGLYLLASLGLGLIAAIGGRALALAV
jgi:CrcB protein